jgi:hypothetical protein
VHKLTSCTRSAGSGSCAFVAEVTVAKHCVAACATCTGASTADFYGNSGARASGNNSCVADNAAKCDAVAVAEGCVVTKGTAGQETTAATACTLSAGTNQADGSCSKSAGSGACAYRRAVLAINKYFCPAAAAAKKSQCVTSCTGCLNYETSPSGAGSSGAFNTYMRCYKQCCLLEHCRFRNQSFVPEECCRSGRHVPERLLGMQGLHK